MTQGDHIPSTAPPIDEFARALSAFQEAQARLDQARDAVDVAQVEQAAAIGALPEGDRADMAQLEAIADRLNINMIRTTSRRAVLCAFAAMPAVAAWPLAARAAPADRSAWDRAFRAYRRARAASDADDPRHRAVQRAFDAACARAPHVTLRPDPYSGIRHPLSTASWEDVRHARRSVRGVVRIDPYPDLVAHMALCRELVAAADARDAVIQRIDDRLGYRASCERKEALGDAASEAESALIETPAPDLAALHWKLESLFGPEQRNSDGSGAAWRAEWVEAFMADARRLLQGEG